MTKTERIKELEQKVEELKAKTKENKEKEEIEAKKMSFAEWFLYHTSREEGLVNQKTVSNMLKISNSRIIQLRNSGRIKMLQYPKDTQKYYSLKEVKKLLEFYNYKREFRIGI